MCVVNLKYIQFLFVASGGEKHSTELLNKWLRTYESINFLLYYWFILLMLWQIKGTIFASYFPLFLDLILILNERIFLQISVIRL